MLLLEPSLRYVLGGNFPSAAQSEGEAAAELFHVSKHSEAASAGVIVHQSLGLDLSLEM